MQLSKTKTYFLLQGLFICCIALVQLFWVFSSTTTGRVIDFGKASTGGKWEHVEIMTVKYWVGYNEYTQTYTRNQTPKWQETVPIRYSRLFPSVSRLDTFESNWEEYFIWYLIFFLATTMVFFIPNEILPRGTIFEIRARRPVLRIRYSSRQSA